MDKYNYTFSENELEVNKDDSSKKKAQKTVVVQLDSAQKLYEESGDVSYLGESIIYEYEIQKDKKDKKFLKRISERFNELLAQDNSAMYLNYYGYILIDHDIDVKKGMSYIRQALKVEPNSSFFLDSLAWGYYKLGECKESLSIIQKVITLEGGDDPEVLKHYKMINECVKNKKR